MTRIAVWGLVGFLSAFPVVTPAIADEPAARGLTSDQIPGTSAEEIIAKNVAARGGLDAWRKIQSMVWVGHIDSVHASQQDIPFVLEMKHPNKTRFEIKAQNQASVRIYDGTHGWKLRASASGKPDLQPYSAEELKFAKDDQVIGEPLVDYQARGISVALDGVDEVEGRRAYRLKVMQPSGASHHLWIDAETFLDVKSDRESRNAFGVSGKILVYYRNYTSIEGLQMPLLIESGGGEAKAPGKDTATAMDKMVIHKIVLNPPLEDRVFARPSVPGGNVTRLWLRALLCSRPCRRGLGLRDSQD